MRGQRQLIAADNLGHVCGCFACVEAGVGTERRRRVPAPDGGDEWIHGQRLRAWLDGREETRARMRRLMTTKGLDPAKAPIGGE